MKYIKDFHFRITEKEYQQIKEVMKFLDIEKISDFGREAIKVYINYVAFLYHLKKQNGKK